MADSIDAQAESAVNSMGDGDRPRHSPQDRRNAPAEGESTGGGRTVPREKTQDALWDDDAPAPEKKPAPRQRPPREDDQDPPAKKPAAAGDPDADPDADPKEGEEKPAKRKYKVNGREIELTPEQEAVAIQRAASADERYQQASQMYKQAQQFQQQMQTLAQQNPAIAAAMRGEDPNAALEEMYLQQMEQEREWAQMSPREQALQQRLAQIEQEKLQYQQEAEAARQPMIEQQRQQHYQAACQEVDEGIMGALDAQGIQPTPEIIAEAAAAMLLHLQARGEKLSPVEATKRASTRRDALVKSAVNSWSVDEALKHLPKKLLDGLRQHEIDRVQSQGFRPRGNARPNDEQQPKNQRKKMSMDEFFNS